MKQAEIIPYSDMTPIITLALDGLTSQHSRRAYAKALGDFLTWYTAEGRPGLSKATIQRYKTVLQGAGSSPSSINLQLSAVRKLAAEAADNGLVDPTLAAGGARVKGVPARGVRAGNWLTRDQAQDLLSSPDLTTPKGRRDRAILAVLVGAGLRRSEAAGLTFDKVHQREGRWVLLDLVGKGNRVRSVPIPSWVKVAIDAWAAAAGIHSGRVFRPVRKGGDLWGHGLSGQAVGDVVKCYARRLGYDLAAHDLRRTFAKLAYRGGAGLDQIQLSLGHASIQTTQRYLGVTQDLVDAPCDHIDLRLSW